MPDSSFIQINFSDFPDDIVLLILLLVGIENPKHLVKMALVCKRFRSLISFKSNEGLFLWSKVCESKGGRELCKVE